MGLHATHLDVAWGRGTIPLALALILILTLTLHPDPCSGTRHENGPSYPPRARKHPLWIRCSEVCRYKGVQAYALIGMQAYALAGMQAYALVGMQWQSAMQVWGRGVSWCWGGRVVML